jgi:hypothetical protein
MMKEHGLRLFPNDVLRIIFVPLRQLSEQMDLQVKLKAMSVTAVGVQKGCETSRFPHFLDNLLRVGGEDVSLRNRPAALYLQEDSWFSLVRG